MEAAGIDPAQDFNLLCGSLPGGNDPGDVAVVGSAAPADHADRRQPIAESNTVMGERRGVALVEFLRLVELGMAQRGCVDPKPTDSVERGRVGKTSRNM